MTIRTIPVAVAANRLSHRLQIIIYLCRKIFEESNTLQKTQTLKIWVNWFTPD